MLKTWIRIARRNLAKSRTFAIINIGGLAVGLASFIVILVYVNYELSYDKWDPSLKTVYKIGLREDQDISSTTPAPLASFLAQKDPHVLAATSIMPAGNYEVLMSTGDRRIYQKGLVTVDSSFLKVFPYRLVRGNPATALNAPNALILSEALSRKLFGNEDPMGKIVKMYNMVDAVVTGIMREPEGPSHLDVQLLMRDPSETRNKFWQNHSYQTYVRLKTQQPLTTLEDNINTLYYDAQIKKGSQTLAEYRKTGNQTGLFADAVADLHNFP